MYENIEDFVFYDFESSEDSTESSPTDSTATPTDSMIMYDINNNLERINYNVGTIMLTLLVIILIKFHNMLRSSFKNNSKEV